MWLDQAKVRNFSIIAHIDHGKSTLADRILELTGTIEPRQMEKQVLDSMDLERERGITIKAHPVRIEYKARDGVNYAFNLIDTPGHVDFTYEVSRSLAACEGAVLVVDASQGIQAQTIANVYLALENGLKIVPVINKIDLPNAAVGETARDIADLLSIFDASSILRISAKTGQGVPELLEAIVDDLPSPEGDPGKTLKALVFDSKYDTYRGVIAFVRLIDGVVKPGDEVLMMATQARGIVEEVGYFRPKMVAANNLQAGEVGYIIYGIKDVEKITVGDTLTSAIATADSPLPGYKPPKPMVFCGLFPMDGSDFELLREALLRFKLNDAALYFEPESSAALGFGFRCGFLGLLHMEIVIERLEREFNLGLLATTPNVELVVKQYGKEPVTIRNPIDFLDEGFYEYVTEPYVSVEIFSPSEFVGGIMELCQSRRAIFKEMSYVSDKRVRFVYHMPLSELIIDFFDLLKSKTRGYASLDYDLLDYRKAELDRVDILLAGERVDALSMIMHRDDAEAKGREVIKKLKSILPRQLFEVAIQATIGKKIIARETLSAKKKDVLAKCYGGDITRKRKLLEKQKEGKKKLKKIGRVEVPAEAFMTLLNIKKET
ncbi:MAG: translation elongation factor 4 [Actinobacteria bacterium]|nr:translation elongation factor 4 [Actinomycetota bacterium]